MSVGVIARTPRLGVLISPYGPFMCYLERPKDDWKLILKVRFHTVAGIVDGKSTTALCQN